MPKLSEQEAKKAFLALLESVDRNANTSLPQGYTVGAGYAPQVVIGMDARVRGLFRSIYYLMRQDHDADAAIIMRSLFSDCLSLVYMEGNRERVEELAVRFLHDSLHDKIGLLKAQRAAGIQLQGRGIEGVQSDIDTLLQFSHTIGMRGTPKTFPNESAMTKAMGIPRLYYLYQWASSHVHATSQAFELHLEHGDGVMRVGVKTDDLPTWVGVAAISADQFTAGHAAAAALLDFDTVAEVLAFRDHIHAKTTELMVASGTTLNVRDL